MSRYPEPSTIERRVLEIREVLGRVQGSIIRDFVEDYLPPGSRELPLSLLEALGHIAAAIRAAEDVLYGVQETRGVIEPLSATLDKMLEDERREGRRE